MRPVCCWLPIGHTLTIGGKYNTHNRANNTRLRTLAELNKLSQALLVFVALVVALVRSWSWRWCWSWIWLWQPLLIGLVSCEPSFLLAQKEPKAGRRGQMFGRLVVQIGAHSLGIRLHAKWQSAAVWVWVRVESHSNILNAAAANRSRSGRRQYAGRPTGRRQRHRRDCSNQHQHQPTTMTAVAFAGAGD